MEDKKVTQRVLIVDDDTHFRRSLAIGLETEGIEVVELPEGLRALEFLLGNQGTESGVSGVVVDARMPGLDGFWLSDQIQDLFPEIQVLILSAHRYNDLPEHYRLMEKPAKMEQIMTALGLAAIHGTHA